MIPRPVPPSGGWSLRGGQKAKVFRVCPYGSPRGREVSWAFPFVHFVAVLRFPSGLGQAAVSLLVWTNLERSEREGVVAGCHAKARVATVEPGEQAVFTRRRGGRHVDDKAVDDQLTGRPA
jgi:hypothetical protein